MYSSRSNITMQCTIQRPKRVRACKSATDNYDNVFPTRLSPSLASTLPKLFIVQPCWYISRSLTELTVSMLKKSRTKLPPSAKRAKEINRPLAIESSHSLARGGSSVRHRVTLEYRADGPVLKYPRALASQRGLPLDLEPCPNPTAAGVAHDEPGETILYNINEDHVLQPDILQHQGDGLTTDALTQPLVETSCDAAPPAPRDGKQEETKSSRKVCSATKLDATFFSASSSLLRPPSWSSGSAMKLRSWAQFCHARPTS